VSRGGHGPRVVGRPGGRRSGGVPVIHPVACADQGALRCSGAQSSGRPSVVGGGHDKRRARPRIRIASDADGADQAGGGTHEEAAMNTSALGRQRSARQRISPSRSP
jgi:hypothetical protein